MITSGPFSNPSWLVINILTYLWNCTIRNLQLISSSANKLFSVRNATDLLAYPNHMILLAPYSHAFLAVTSLLIKKWLKILKRCNFYFNIMYAFENNWDCLLKLLIMRQFMIWKSNLFCFIFSVSLGWVIMSIFSEQSHTSVIRSHKYFQQNGKKIFYFQYLSNKLIYESFHKYFIFLYWKEMQKAFKF